MSCSEIIAREGMCLNRKLYNYIILVALLTTCLFRTNLILLKLSLRRRRMPEQLSQL